ncbi:MAG TPA: RodZ domain-containing protein [Actinomycetota bacterium]|nr:RodZ domain-containing protein [Actinomycetota bacterium]
METTTGIGRALRVERERKRLSLETIARATMVSTQYLEAIDDDRLHDLPSGAYAKGFIRAYANYLGLDPVPFIRAYESGHEGPGGPDLQSLNLQPVRVPRAVEPRAWRMAFAAAVAVLMLLGMIGALGSDGETAGTLPPPEVAFDVSPARVVEEAEDEVRDVTGAVVRVEAKARVWVGSHVDGEPGFEGFIEAGQRRSFRGKDSVYLVIGNARSVRLYANGMAVGTPAEDTYRGTFTARTKSLPPSEPQ